MREPDGDGVSPRADETDAKPTPVLTAEWALWGKRVRGPQDGVLMCSVGTLGKLDFTEIINRYAPGTPDGVQYTMGWLPGAGSAPDFVTLAIHQHFPHGPAQPGTGARYGTPGGDIVTVRLFCVRYADLAEHGVSYAELLDAVQQLEPASGSLPFTVSIPSQRSPGPGAGRGGELAQAVATLLLTDMPVCVLGADDISAAARVSFIDAVMSWLPYGLRARLSASTWASSTAQALKLRLFFASARRDDDGRTHHVQWGEPPRLALDRGRDEAAALYLDWLRRTGNQAQAPLAGLTNPLRFGAADIRPMVAALPRDVTLAEALEDLGASLRHGDGAAAQADIRRIRRYLVAPLDPADRDRCRHQIMEQGLLKDHPEIQSRIKAGVYRALLSLAFETPLTYTGYCQIEDAAGGPPHATLRAEMLRRLEFVSFLPWLLTARAESAYTDEELMKALAEHGTSADAPLNEFERGVERLRPAHRALAYDFAVRYLLAHAEDARAELKQRGYLATMLEAVFPRDRQAQQARLEDVLKMVYGGSLSQGQIRDLFTDSQLRPTAAFENAVVRLASSPRAGDFVARQAAYARLRYRDGGDESQPARRTSFWQQVFRQIW
jgi:hypothetical protein